MISCNSSVFVVIVIVVVVLHPPHSKQHKRMTMMMLMTLKWRRKKFSFYSYFLSSYIFSCFCCLYVWEWVNVVCVCVLFTLLAWVCEWVRVAGWLGWTPLSFSLSLFPLFRFLFLSPRHTLNWLGCLLLILWLRL